MPHILIVEDEAIIRGSIKRLLSKSGYQVTDADSVQSALELGDISRFDLILSDLRMPGALGTDLIQYAESTPVLIMTSYASMKTAVDTLKAGAVDYIAKPFSNQDLLASIAKNIRADETKDSPAKTSNTPHHKLIGNSAPMRKLYKQIYKVANTDVTVLVNGETGTGKELIARALHDNSPRANEPMISVNCAAIPDSLIEAELFGHEKGAFTGAYNSMPGKFEQAEGGTLLLDEISEMEIGIQAKLLRVLQEREVERLGGRKTIKLNVRVLATTNRDLMSYVNEHKFREDLYYRLSVFPLQWKSLRERREDILPIAERLLLKHSKKQGKSAIIIDDGAQQKLQGYPWPGNVRELDNVIQRALIIQSGHQISAGDIVLNMENMEPRKENIVSIVDVDEDDLGNSLKQREYTLILDALRNEKSKKEAAEKLGISPRTLRYKMAKMREQGIHA